MPRRGSKYAPPTDVREIARVYFDLGSWWATGVHFGYLPSERGETAKRVAVYAYSAAGAPGSVETYPETYNAAGEMVGKLSYEEFCERNGDNWRAFYRWLREQAAGGASR